jgi:dihydroorotate dehydrogenase electron transfer subunit
LTTEQGLSVSDTALPAPISCLARFITNVRESSGLIRLDVALDQPLEFRPGQFAMLNLAGPDRPFVFSRPFSILAVRGTTASFLYRVVGRGTQALADLKTGQTLTVLGPLGQPFPEPSALGETPVVLIAGGVGLPPLHNWFARNRRADDLAFFGGRDGADIPWELLAGRWQVSVDAHRDVPSGAEAWQGRVTDLVAQFGGLQDDRPRVVMSCGPVPLLKAAAALAQKRGWPCHLSLEEHMGCGYGVCKGCVVPVHDPGREGWRNATCCQEGPVFLASEICWERYGQAAAGMSSLPRAD